MKNPSRKETVSGALSGLRICICLEPQYLSFDVVSWVLYLITLSFSAACAHS